MSSLTDPTINRSDYNFGSPTAKYSSVMNGMNYGVQVSGPEFVIGFAITSLIGGFLSAKLLGNRAICTLVAYLGQMAIGAVVAVFGYFAANAISEISGFVWTNTFDWQVGRWIAFVVITAFYAKNVWDAYHGPEFKPALVVGRCGSNPKKFK